MQNAQNLSEFAGMSADSIYSASLDDLTNASGPAIERVRKLLQEMKRIHHGRCFRGGSAEDDAIKPVPNYSRQNWPGAADLMVACAISQHPFLMIGPPGHAKTQAALTFFELLGLARPSEGEEERDQIFFQVLLTPFTYYEELFGPLQIKELNRGVVKRANKRMLTGKGVRAAVFVEVFRAHPNLLNSLLGVINERHYMDEGVFKPCDLVLVMGASNRPPLADDESGLPLPMGRTVVDPNLEALYDRFFIRCYIEVPPVSPGFRGPDASGPSDREKMRDEIHAEGVLREGQRLHQGQRATESPVACVNDLLVLGRVLASQIERDLPKERDARLKLHQMADALQAPDQAQLCTINPRKRIRLETVARALAMLAGGTDAPLAEDHASVLAFTWDDPRAADDLAEFVRSQLV